MNLTKHVQILPAARWGLSFGDAGYYGRRWWAHIGPVHFILWQMTAEQYDAWWDREDTRIKERGGECE